MRHARGKWYKTSQTVTSLTEFGKFLYGITHIVLRSRRKDFPTGTLSKVAVDRQQHIYLRLSWILD